jgi:hypothetical protein
MTPQLQTAPRCSIFPSPDPARDALRLFSSVGVTEFDESTICDGRRDYVRSIPAAALLETIDERMEVQRYGSPYILRPIQPASVALIQLDDIAPERVTELTDFAFIVYQTSGAKYQAWIAVHALEAERDALRRATIRHYGSDPNASGATRWPGSMNEKYRPSYPVRILAGAPGRLLRVADLPVTVAPPRPATAPPRPRMTGLLPNYQTELERAAGNANQADWLFSVKALSSSRGCSAAQVIEALLEHSPTAQKRPKMITYTVERARKVAR